MNQATLKRSLITIGLLTLVGTVGAETYSLHKAPEHPGPHGSQVRVEHRAPEASTGVEASPEYGSWNPWSEMRRIQQQIDRVFEDSWQRMHADIGTFEPTGAAPSEPEVTLQDKQDDYVVTAKLPGIEEGDVNVSLDGRLLRISAQSQSQEKETADNGEVVREERYASHIQRAFTLPGPVDASRMHTQFDDGVLRVTIPKATS